MANRIPISFTASEKRKIKGLAKKLGLSFSNYVRQQLGLDLLSHGGLRPNNGRRNCARCEREWSDKVKALGEGLCRECWHEQADAVSTM